jgi:ribosomal protein L10
MSAVLRFQGLREVGESVILMGKNTMMKRSIRLYCERTGDEKWQGLLDSLVGNVGLIFTKGDLADVSASCSLWQKEQHNNTELSQLRQIQQVHYIRCIFSLSAM